MSQQSYLIDTNILIALEDYHTVKVAYAKFSSLTSSHKVKVFVHAVAGDDIKRDKNAKRRNISLSKIAKYRILAKQRGLTRSDLEADFGPLKKDNDEVDATLLHALNTDAVDFLVTQDKGLHQRAQSYSPELGRRVLFVSDAVGLLTQTYEPKEVPIRHVADVEAYTINPKDKFFNSLKDGYPEFADWWKKKCVKGHRSCWVVYDNDELAGLVVRKDECALDTDAITKAKKILKVCTFKISPEKRGVKLGELLLKQVLWFAQANGYDLTYLTAYKDQVPLMELLEYYGFCHAGMKSTGELIYERSFASTRLTKEPGKTVFESARQNYPRFLVTDKVRGFGIPIKEKYHDTLYPDLQKPQETDVPKRPGNTIRKVYLCHAPANLVDSGSILFFYKSKSKEPPSQSITAIGILESMTRATSTRDLMKMAGGRSVYGEEELKDLNASPEKPVKVINYLLVSYIYPPVSLKELINIGVVKNRPPLSIYEIKGKNLRKMLKRAKLGFDI